MREEADLSTNHDVGLTHALSTEQAVWLLGSLAGLHRKPFDAELLIKRFAPPWDLPTLIEALAGLGLKAQPVPWPDPAQPPPPFPVVAFARSVGQDSAGPPLLIASRSDGQLGLFRPGEAPSELEDLHAMSHEAQPWLLLCAAQDPAAPARDEDSATQAKARQGGTTNPANRSAFGFSWFIPELLRHRKLWRDVLLASLAIQLVGLATPLFTQVIIDKVIAHHSVSTLWVLGEQVMRHLLRLPLPYFEARPTGTLVARLQGVETLREFVSGAAVTLLLDLPFLFIFLAVMFWYSWVLSLVAVGLLLLIVLVSVVMVPVFRQRLDQQFLLGARNQAFLTEYLSGMATVKALQMELDVDKRYGTYLAQYLQAGFATRQVGNTYQVSASALEQTMTLAILIVGAWTVMHDSNFTVGTGRAPPAPAHRARRDPFAAGTAGGGLAEAAAPPRPDGAARTARRHREGVGHAHRGHRGAARHRAGHAGAAAGTAQGGGVGVQRRRRLCTVGPAGQVEVCGLPVSEVRHGAWRVEVGERRCAD